MMFLHQHFASILHFERSLSLLSRLAHLLQQNCNVAPDTRKPGPYPLPPLNHSKQVLGWLWVFFPIYCVFKAFKKKPLHSCFPGPFGVDHFAWSRGCRTKNEEMSLVEDKLACAAFRLWVLPLTCFVRFGIRHNWFMACDVLQERHMSSFFPKMKVLGNLASMAS